MENLQVWDKSPYCYGIFIVLLMFWLVILTFFIFSSAFNLACVIIRITVYLIERFRQEWRKLSYFQHLNTHSKDSRQLIWSKNNIVKIIHWK